jgi:hypothetical protein
LRLFAEGLREARERWSGELLTDAIEADRELGRCLDQVVPAVRRGEYELALFLLGQAAMHAQRLLELTASTPQPSDRDAAAEIAS